MICTDPTCACSKSFACRWDNHGDCFVAQCPCTCHTLNSVPITRELLVTLADVAGYDVDFSGELPLLVRRADLRLARDLLDCADAIESFANEIRRIAGTLPTTAALGVSAPMTGQATNAAAVGAETRGADQSGVRPLAAQPSGPSVSNETPDLREQAGAVTGDRIAQSGA